MVATVYFLAFLTTRIFRVSLAKFKWINGRVLLVHALTQLAFGITRWTELEKIDSGYGSISTLDYEML